MTEIELNVIDLTAKKDSLPAGVNGQSFSDFSPLVDDDVAPYVAGTLEQDFFLLDGSMPLFPDSPQGLPWGYWSTQMSNDTGSFSTPPQVHVTFSAPHTSAGIALKFGGDAWAKEVEIIWKSASGEILRAKKFTPDGLEYNCEAYVEGYSAIYMTFGGTSKPYRYLKLVGIDYGVKKIFREEICAASIHEETSMINTELPIGTLDVTLYSDEGGFNLFEPSGVYKALRQRQPIKATQYEGDKIIPMGTYYLDTWESEDDNTAVLHAVDLLGVIDTVEFMGDIYNNGRYGAIIEEIMKAAGRDDYTIHDDLLYQRCNGWIPICTCREALLTLLTLTNWHVDCTRRDGIYIHPPWEEVGVINAERVLDTPKITQELLYTEAIVTGHKYSAEAEETEQLKIEEQVTGTLDLRFDAPVTDLRITGTIGELLGASANYIRWRPKILSTKGIIVYGRKYQDYTTKSRSGAGGTPSNIIEADGTTMIDNENVDGYAEVLYDCAQHRFISELTIELDNERVGMWVLVDRGNGKYTREYIESMDIDLMTWLADIRTRGKGEIESGGGVNVD